jgi:hypothetical protein
MENLDGRKRKAAWSKTRKKARSCQIQLRNESKNVATAEAAIRFLLEKKYGCEIESHQVDALFKRALDSKPLSSIYVHLSAIIKEV